MRITDLFRRREAPPPAGVDRSRHTARYMNHDRTGILSMRRATSREWKVDVREATVRSLALATDFLQNSGWISGAADQIVADMVGPELRLNATPDLSRLGYTDGERQAWCRIVEAEWHRWSLNAAECDLEGKATVPEILDGAIRHYLASGEAIAVLDYLSPADRARYGISTGTKVRLVGPHRLSRYTSPVEGWEQGIYHDEIGRPAAYRFRQAVAGIDRDVEIPARQGALERVILVMDRGATPGSPRGISPMTPAFRVIAQSDQLADATLTTALLQTAFAATITSPEPSEEAFQALENLENLERVAPGVFEGAGEIAADLFSIWGARIDALRSKALSVGGDATQVNHLGPGESLQLHGVQTPGPQYLPFQQSLLREVARCLGVTFETLTMDHSNASYSSVRMAIASIWPTIVRRRQRIPAPMAQRIYEAWLDEAIGSGRVPIRGGYRAFEANRAAICSAEWRGPPRPSADPYKDRLADKLGLEAGTTTIQKICAENGQDWEEVLDQAAREIQRMTEIGITPPHGRILGGNGGGPNGAAAEGRREPANEQ